MQFAALLALVVLAGESPEWDRGLRHLEAKEYREALAVFEPLCRSGSLTRENEGRCWGNVSEAYLHLANYDQAIAFANKAIGLGSTESYSRLGASYLAKRAFVDAVKTLKKSSKSIQEFYGVNDFTEACVLRNDLDGCRKACAVKATTNELLRVHSCDRGRQDLMNRCDRSDGLEACRERCDLEIEPTPTSFRAYVTSLESSRACVRVMSLTRVRALTRAQDCTAGNVIQCELSCDEDKNGASCEQGKVLRAGERLDRLTKCEARDEIACVTACEIDENPAACSVLETLRLQTISTWKAGCAANDYEACHELGEAYRDGKQGRAVDKPIAAEFFMTACRAGRAISCTAARAIATPSIRVELEHRECQEGNGSACRAEGVALIDAERVPEGVALLSSQCENDVASCRALGDSMRTKDSSIAERGYLRACEGGDGTACTTLFDAWYDGTWLNEDKGEADDLYEDRCVDVDDDAPRINTCSQMASRIRNADRRVPGEKGSELVTFRYGAAATLGIDTNPYRTARATVNDSQGEDVVGFGLYPAGVLTLAPNADVTLHLGRSYATVGASVRTKHFANLLSETDVAHAGALNLLGGHASVFARAGIALQAVRLSVVDIASVDLYGGAAMPIGALPQSEGLDAAPATLIPYGGAVFGDQTLREQNHLRARADLVAGPLVGQARYDFVLARVSSTKAIESVNDLTALIAPGRLTAPGVAKITPEVAGLLDEHRHHVGARLGFNLEDLLELDGTLFVDVTAGFERYLRGDLIPGVGIVGVDLNLEDEIHLEVAAGLGTIDLANQVFSTWVGDASFRFAFDDSEPVDMTMGLVRKIVGHPTLSYVVLNAGYGSVRMGLDDVALTGSTTFGVLDLGATPITPSLAAAPINTALFGNLTGAIDVPLGVDRLAARVGGEIEFLDPSITAQAAARDVPVGNSIGYGRVSVFAGISY